MTARGTRRDADFTPAAECSVLPRAPQRSLSASSWFARDLASAAPSVRRVRRRRGRTGRSRAFLLGVLRKRRGPNMHALQHRIRVVLASCIVALTASQVAAQEQQPQCGDDVKAYIVEALSKYEDLESQDALAVQKGLYEKFK